MHHGGYHLLAAARSPRMMESSTKLTMAKLKTSAPLDMMTPLIRPCCCFVKYTAPMSKTAIAIASVVAPSALPIFRVREVCEPSSVVFSLNSWATVTPNWA